MRPSLRAALIFSTVLVYAAPGHPQPRDLPQIMKEVGPAWQALAVSVGDERLSETARRADVLVSLFDEAGAFFRREKLADAVDMARLAAQAAADTAKALARTTSTRSSASARES